MPTSTLFLTRRALTAWSHRTELALGYETVWITCGDRRLVGADTPCRVLEHSGERVLLELDDNGAQWYAWDDADDIN